MATSLHKIVIAFMQQEYSIAPSQRSLEIIVAAGFKRIKDPNNQFRNLESVEGKIRGSDFDSLTAKVFSLAFPYEYALTQLDGQTREWSSWLGTAEYKLGRLMAEQDIRNNLFNKSLEHLLVARQKGNISKENASLTGDCYFRLGRYEEGISEYERALELAKQERFSGNWMVALDHALENSYWLLDKARETIQSPFYGQLMQRFQAFYNNFVDFWKANEPNKHNFRLNVSSLSSQTGAIGVGSGQAT